MSEFKPMISTKLTPDEVGSVRDISRVIEASYSVECGRCNERISVFATSEWQASVNLWRKGWRRTDVTLCPECVAISAPPAD